MNAREEKTRHLARLGGMTHHLLRIHYKDKSGTETERLVEPYELRGPDLWAWSDHAPSGIRRFKLAHITRAALTTVGFAPRWPFKDDTKQ